MNVNVSIDVEIQKGQIDMLNNGFVVESGSPQPTDDSVKIEFHFLPAPPKTRHRRATKANTKPKAQKRAADLSATVDAIKSEGVLSANGIAAALNKRKIRKPRGGRWTTRSVLDLMARTLLRANKDDHPQPANGQPSGPAVPDSFVYLTNASAGEQSPAEKKRLRDQGLSLVEPTREPQYGAQIAPYAHSMRGWSAEVLLARATSGFARLCYEARSETGGACPDWTRDPHEGPDDELLRCLSVRHGQGLLISEPVAEIKAGLAALADAEEEDGPRYVRGSFTKEDFKADEAARMDAPADEVPEIGEAANDICMATNDNGDVVDLPDAALIQHFGRGDGFSIAGVSIERRKRASKYERADAIDRADELALWLERFCNRVAEDTTIFGKLVEEDKRLMERQRPFNQMLLEEEVLQYLDLPLHLLRIAAPLRIQRGCSGPTYVGVLTNIGVYRRAGLKRRAEQRIFELTTDDEQRIWFSPIGWATTPLEERDAPIERHRRRVRQWLLSGDTRRQFCADRGRAPNSLNNSIRVYFAKLAERLNAWGVPYRRIVEKVYVVDGTLLIDLDEIAAFIRRSPPFTQNLIEAGKLPAAMYHGRVTASMFAMKEFNADRRETAKSDLAIAA
jgi:hypothetical protein